MAVSAWAVSMSLWVNVFFGIAAFNSSPSSVVGRVIAIYAIIIYANLNQILWEQKLIE